MTFHFSLKFSILVLMMIPLWNSAKAQSGTVEVIAIRHGESLNNILSQKKNPIGFFIEMYKQKGARDATQTITQNPVLSSEGREQAIGLNRVLFPNGEDKQGLLKGENTVFYVSPLNRTIQTAVLVFSDQLFNAGVDMIANPHITEHRKSTSEDGFEDAERPYKLFEKEYKETFESELTGQKLQQFVDWKTKFKSSLEACCNKVWWPNEGTESKESLEARIAKFKDQLKERPDNSRVIIVSHGTFLRTLFFGTDELDSKKYHIRNLGMLIGTFDKKTGDWLKARPPVSCFDPEKQEAATGPKSDTVCFDKSLPKEGIEVIKGPVYELGQSEPWFGSWQTRRLNMVRQATGVGVTWSKNETGGKLMGAALVLGSVNGCNFPNQYKEKRETECLLVRRVLIDSNNVPQWNQVAVNSAQEVLREVLRISWDASNKDATEAIRKMLQEGPEQ